MHNKIVKANIVHTMKMVEHLGNTRQWNERRVWARRLRFWLKLRHRNNKEVITLLIDLIRRAETGMIGHGRLGFSV